MAYSVGLALYNLPWRRGAGTTPDWPDRPKGRLVWLHAPHGNSARPLLELGRRLIEDDGLPVLLTCPDAVAAKRGLIVVPPPADTPAAARAFLDHWRPEIALVAEGEVRPALLHDAAERRIPLVLVDGREPHLPAGREGWWPGLLRGAMGLFSHVLTLDEAAARAFRRAGAPGAAVRVVGRMEEGSGALPCNEAERASLARQLGTRPVWLAAGLPQAEEAAVIQAHRSALRLAHRLLLVIVPDDPDRAATLSGRLATDEGWGVARRAAEEEPDPTVEVYIADTPAEYGLWYRLSPVTYLGGSLSETGCLCDPMEAAALGSALIAGRKAGAYGAGMDRLRQARAAVTVNSPADLAEALADLLAPDKVARLAQAAWTVASDGAEVTDDVLDLIRGILDGKR